MKELVERTVLNMPMDKAFDLVFEDPRVLDALHQKNKCMVSPWRNNKRQMTFEMPSEGMPRPVLTFLGSGAVKIDTWQSRHWSEDKSSVIVTNKVRPKILGAELIKIRPTLTLTRHPEDGANKTMLTMSCKLNAIMPPPLNGMLESVMLHSSQLHYGWFKAALEQFGQSDGRVGDGSKTELSVPIK